MPYSRRLPRVPPTGRIAVRLTTDQRDLFIRSPDTPQNLGRALHRAPVRSGRLSIRLDRQSLDALIASAAKMKTADRRAGRALDALLRYLESLDDRFTEPAEERGDTRPATDEPSWPDRS